MEKSLSMSGGQLYCQAYWHRLLQLIVDGKLDATWEFTHRFTLEQIPLAYDLFAHRKDNVLKVIVYTPFGLECEREHASKFRPAGAAPVKPSEATPTHRGKREVPVV